MLIQQVVALIQIKYSFLFRPEKSCTIYCKQVRTPEYTSPQLYLTESDGVDLFFPDGTLCHNDGNQNYYCLRCYYHYRGYHFLDFAKQKRNLVQDSRLFH